VEKKITSISSLGYVYEKIISSTLLLTLGVYGPHCRSTVKINKKKPAIYIQVCPLASEEKYTCYNVEHVL